MEKIMVLWPCRLPGGGVALWWRLGAGGWRLVCGESWGQVGRRLGELLRAHELSGPPPGVDPRQVVPLDLDVVLERVP